MRSQGEVMKLSLARSSTRTTGRCVILYDQADNLPPRRTPGEP